jgi:putative ABC transport system permease protein
MTVVISAFTLGLILSLLALGIYISFRIFEFPDVTVDSSVTLGASVAAVLLLKKVNPLLAVLACFVAGVLAGSLTGILHTRFKINNLLSGILVMTGLYSINLHILGKSNVSLSSVPSLATWSEAMAKRVVGGKADWSLLGWRVPAQEMGMFCVALCFVVVVGLALFIFFRTNLGTAMRATGDNSQMIRALGVNVEHMTTIGLALANGLVAVAGALLAQYQGFTDVSMGIGMIVLGLASVIVGESLVGTRQLGLMIVGTVMGSILFRLLVAIALQVPGVEASDLKLITAIFVFAALVLPGVLAKMKKKGQTHHA